MSDPGVKAALAEMGELIRTSGGDWLRAMRRRAWLLVVLIVAVIGTNKLLLHFHYFNQQFNWMQVLASALFSVSFFADAMRTIHTGYRIDIRRALRLFGIAIQVVLIMVVAAIVPGAIALLALHSTLAAKYALVSPVIVFIQSKYSFVWFLSESDEDVIAGSWRLTAGATLVASIVPSLLVYAAANAPALASALFVHRYGWFTPYAQYELLETIVEFAAFAWVYPLLARWLTVCTRLHPHVEPSPAAA